MSNLNQWSLKLFEWTEANQGLLASLFGLSLLLFIGSLSLIPLLVTRMRTDYFVVPSSAEYGWLGRHPAARITVRLIRNSLGIVLLVAGIVMMVLPGQGIITILVALSLLEFPGKRAMELHLIHQRHIGRTVNWIRMKSGRPPLMIPEI